MEEGRINYVKGLMCDWLHLVDNLTHDQPQAAYAAFTRSVQNKESYLKRLVPDCAFLFQELECKIAQEFWFEVSTDESSLFPVMAV